MRPEATEGEEQYGNGNDEEDRGEQVRRPELGVPPEELLREEEAEV